MSEHQRLAEMILEAKKQWVEDSNASTDKERAFDTGVAWALTYAAMMVRGQEFKGQK